MSGAGQGEADLNGSQCTEARACALLAARPVRCSGPLAEPLMVRLALKPCGLAQIRVPALVSCGDNNKNFSLLALLDEGLFMVKRFVQ